MAFKRLLGYENPDSKISYSGSYLNFNEVLMKFGPQDQYSNLEQFNLAIEQAKALLSNFETQAFANIGWASQRLNFLPNFLAALNLDTCKILDIGGGFGETYLHIKKSVPIEIEYDIIELEKTVQVGRELYKNHRNLNFYTLDSYSSTKYDLVYFGSSLQYFEDWQATIRNALVSKPKYILISDTTVGDVPTFVCAQVNDSRVVIPRWVFHIQDLDDLFSNLGYSRKVRTSNFYPFHNFHNYEEKYRNIEHTNLAYIRT
jgi:putative methyltransferase (TIGR04325 family)